MHVVNCSQFRLIVTILFFVLLTITKAHGSDEVVCLSGYKSIESIEISGNTRTKPHVIEREFGIFKEDKVCELQIIEGIKRLKNIGLFSKVDYQITHISDNSIKLFISLTEKWTTIPILKINSGGGVSQYTLGVYDPNVFGEFLETGIQYENLAGANSGVVWFKNPRLFDQRQGIDLQYWNTKRIRIKYDQDKNTAEIKNGFLHEREKMFIEYYREIVSEVLVRLSLDYNKDSFSKDVLPQEVIDVVGPNPMLPPSTELIITRLGAEFGRIEGEAQTLNGKLLNITFGYAHPLKNNVDSFAQGDVNFTIYKSLSPEWQFAQRFMGGVTSTKVLQYKYYLGGLDRIRGFSDNRFAGTQFALANSEARYLIAEKSSFLLQGVGFLDFAAISEQSSDLLKLKAASVGAGVRFILPQFYRFVVRFDYAKPLLKSDSMNWSFGVQQFF